MPGGSENDANIAKRCFTISLKEVPSDEVVIALDVLLRSFNVISVSMRKTRGDV